MAARDIMPWTSPLGGHVEIRHFRLNASETFQVGEPVSMNADGELTESADDPVDDDLMGIALTGPGGGTLINPRTGAAYALGDLIPVVIPNANTLFITRNFSAAGSAFNDTAPAVADLGDEVGLSLISDSWGVDQSTTNNPCRIIDILNDLKQSIQETGETLATTDTYYIVFQIVAHQSASLGNATAPAA